MNGMKRMNTEVGGVILKHRGHGETEENRENGKR
jgi:hypothetical protein